LRTAQDRLIQTEKLASLGQLTAGIKRIPQLKKQKPGIAAGNRRNKNLSAGIRLGVGIKRWSSCVAAAANPTARAKRG
jgi:hypothetical protein